MNCAPRRVRELGVDAHFGRASIDDMMQSLRVSGEPGRRWLEELEISREPCSTSTSAMVSITITAVGTTICPCRLPRYRLRAQRTCGERWIARLGGSAMNAAS